MPYSRLILFPLLLASLAWISQGETQDNPTHPPAPPLQEVREGATFLAADTLQCGEENNPDAAACLRGLEWRPTTFTVRCETSQPDCGDWLVRFPSPRPVGNPTNNLVALEWYAARDAAGAIQQAPAVVVVHESGRGMVAGRTIAKSLCSQDLHTFLIHLPGYGARTSALAQDPKNILPALRQAVADVRRARDAVAALPHVDRDHIGLQGTSLGGFVVATVAGLDRGYRTAVIFLAGGRIADVIFQGGRDAAALRRKLLEAGITDQEIRNLTQVVEPLRLAHRVDPKNTWLFSSEFDEVVPSACTSAFVRAAKLDRDHHIVLPAGHYSAAFLLPVILPKVSRILRGLPTSPAEP